MDMNAVSYLQGVPKSYYLLYLCHHLTIFQHATKKRPRIRWDEAKEGSIMEIIEHGKMAKLEKFSKNGQPIKNYNLRMIGL